LSLLRRVLLFCLLVIGCAVAFTQEQPANHPNSSTQAAQPAKRPSIQSELTKASEAAAGEEEEGSEFKQSASVKWIASHTALSPKGAYWLLIIINFAIVAAVVGYFWKANAPAAFRTRTETIRKALDEARRASEDANRRLSDIEGRLSRLDTEIAEMKATAEREAAAEEARIKAAAEEDRHKVIESAEQEIDAAAKAARRELKAYVAELAVTLAEQRIHVDSNTDQALVETFVRQLGSGKDGR
jgi:F-type H+-transporting ATPase subunit b